MHNYKYQLKTLFRKKTLIFWTYAFPIILGLLFNFAFADVEKSDELDVIDIAIVNNENFKNNDYYKQAYKSLSKGKDKLFNTEYVTLDEAKELLDDDEISGYIQFLDNAEVYVKSTGYKETVIKYVTDEIIEKEKLVADVSKKLIQDEIINSGFVGDDITYIYEEAIDIINQAENKENIKDLSPNNLGYMIIEFYTLIAMACLYGAMLASTSLNENLANMSNTGKRIATSKTSKRKIVISSMLAAYTAQLGGLLLLYLFTIFILNINYGSNLLLIILLSLAGSFAGLALGIFVSSIFKVNEGNKNGIIISVTMLCSFLSGMMGVSMKYIIDKNFPIINKINPASMITDGFYSLYYYDTLERYWFNIISLLIFSFILLLISINSLRRQKYDSI